MKQSRRLSGSSHRSRQQARTIHIHKIVIAESQHSPKQRTLGDNIGSEAKQIAERLPFRRVGSAGNRNHVRSALPESIREQSFSGNSDSRAPLTSQAFLDNLQQ